MKLRSSIDVWFSRLEDNWEECGFFYDFSTDRNDRHDKTYRRYGDLPDGRHFGVYIWPGSEAWPDASIMMIVGETGEMQVNTEIDGRWDARNDERWPLAAAASPSGKSIVWLKDEKLWVWHEDRKDRCFLPEDGEVLSGRIGDLRVLDAIMRADGILELYCENEEVFGYLCDEDIVLVPWEDGWIPANERENPWSGQRPEYWPDSFAVMIREKDDKYAFYDCGVRRVCFEQGLEVIKAGVLASNPELGSVTIPASVKEVQSWAFGICTNLKDLVIEGDLSRAADWPADIFEGCACEEYYLRLRNAGIEAKRMEQEELKRFLTKEITSGRDLDNSEDFKNALKKCTDDEFLYLIAENVPQYRIEEMAAAGIQSDEYRYAMISSSLKGRRALIHDLAVSRELDEMLAVRVLLTDLNENNKNEALRAIRSEALLMLAFLNSFSYRAAAKERLKETGSAYPERYYEEMDREEKETAVKGWYAEACEYAERLIGIDRDMNDKVSVNVDIDSSMLVGFLAACHPDKTKKAEYAEMIASESERLAAYVGAITEDADVRRILSREIHREDLLEALPYCHSFDSCGREPFLMKDTYEKRVEFCLEVLRNTDREETRQFLTEQMKHAGIDIPAELQKP